MFTEGERDPKGESSVRQWGRERGKKTYWVRDPFSVNGLGKWKPGENNKCGRRPKEGEEGLCAEGQVGLQVEGKFELQWVKWGDVRGALGAGKTYNLTRVK